MYPTSTAFQTAIKARSRNSLTWYGTITLTNDTVISYTDADIVEGSGTLTRKCSKDESINIGGVFASELVMSLLITIDRYLLANAVIDLYCRVNLGSVTTWGEASAYGWDDLSLCTWGDNPKVVISNIPMGKFIVSEALRSSNAVKITAYDYMLKFGQTLPSLSTASRTPYTWLNLICSRCGVTLGMTQTEVEELTNSNQSFSYISVNSDTKTYRDLLAELAEAMGCVAYMNRFGQLIFKQYSMTVDDTIGSSLRYTSDFSDFQSYYTGLRASMKAKAVSEYVTNSDTDTGLVYDIGYNCFLQISNDTTRQQVLQNIIDAQIGIKYTPFKVNMPSNPAYDMMDVLQFTENQSGIEDIAPITSLIYRIGGSMDVSCGGTDPALAEAQSRESKAIEGLSSGTVSGSSSFGGEAAWLMIDSYPDTATTIADTSTNTTSIVITTTTDVSRTQITWTGTYELSADSTITAVVYVDTTVVYTVHDVQAAGLKTFSLTTGYEIKGKGTHTIKVMLSAEEVTADESEPGTE